MLCYTINSSIMTDNEKKGKKTNVGEEKFVKPHWLEAADEYYIVWKNANEINQPQKKSHSERYLKKLYKESERYLKKLYKELKSAEVNKKLAKWALEKLKQERSETKNDSLKSAEVKKKIYRQAYEFALAEFEVENIEEKIKHFQKSGHLDGDFSYEFDTLDREEALKEQQRLEAVRRNKNNNQPNKNIPSIRKKNKVVCK